MEKKLTAPELLDEDADARKLLEERVGGLPTPPHWTFKFPNEIVAKPCPTMFTLDNRLRALEKPILGDPSEEKLRQKLLNDVEEWRAAPEELVREELGRVLAFAEKPENYSNEYEAGKIGAQRALFILGVHACVGRPITLRELEALDAKGKGSTPPAERLFGEDARVILKRAGNFLIGDPWDTEKPQPQPFEFYHPGYARAILEEELYVQADETAPAIPATTGPLRSS